MRFLDEHVLGINGLSYPSASGMAHYAEDFAQAFAKRTEVKVIKFLSWKTPYPRLLYHGALTPPGDVQPRDPKIQVRPALAYNRPSTWRRGAQWLAGASVIHFHAHSILHMYIQGSVARRVRRAGVVTTFHILEPQDGNEPNLRWVPKRLARRCDQIVAHSPAIRRRILEEFGVPDEDVHVVPHPTYAISQERTLDVREARRRLGIPLDTPTLLFFGAIRPYKGVPILLEALQQVPDANLVIAGHCWSERALIQRLAEHPRVKGRVFLFLDHIPESRIPEFFSAADACVFPFTAKQGDSGTIRMAQSFRRPVITSDLYPPAAGVVGRSPVAEGVTGLANAINIFLSGGGAAPPTEAVETISWPECVERLTRIHQVAFERKSQ